MKRHIVPKPLPEPQIIIKEVVKEIEVVKYITQYVTQPAQIITKEVIPSNISEELTMLKQKLEEKEALISQINTEKMALWTQLSEKDVLISQINADKMDLWTQLSEKDISINQLNSDKKSLSAEVAELKEDKVYLRSDKQKLYEEIDFLRKSTLVSKEKLNKKASNLEKWYELSSIEKLKGLSKFNKEFSTSTDELVNVDILERMLLNGTGESIYPSNISANEIACSVGIPVSLNSSILEDDQNSSILGDAKDSFSIIE